MASLDDIPGVEMVVVDNDSRDGTAIKLKEEFSSVTLIALQDNIGFGRACNIGVAASSGPFIFLLNPDAVASPHALKKIITFLEDHPQAGIVGASLTDLFGQPLESMEIGLLC